MSWLPRTLRENCLLQRHLPYRVPLHRWRPGLDQPLSLSVQHHALGVGPARRGLLGLFARCGCHPAPLQGAPALGQDALLDTDDVTALYPRANDFRALRRKLDPGGRFLNDHVRALLG